MTYHFGDVHMNEEVYTDPEKWDPDRFGEGREEDKKVPFGFIGWGVGRHPCLGMKVSFEDSEVNRLDWLTDLIPSSLLRNGSLQNSNRT